MATAESQPVADDRGADRVDEDAMFREFRATRPSYPIVLRVRDHAVRRFRPTAPMHPETDGWWIIHTDLENIHEARAAVLAQAGDAAVVAPPELADLVRDASDAISVLHTPATRPTVHGDN